MPTYNFYNKDTKEVEEHFMSISSLDQFKEDNPHLNTVITTPGIIGGVSMDSGKLPDGFKDRLRLMKDKHPLSKGVDHLI